MDHIMLASVKNLHWLSCSKLFLTPQKDPSYVAIHVSSDGNPKSVYRNLSIKKSLRL